jgi:hypothetical protein
MLATTSCWSRRSPLRNHRPHRNRLAISPRRKIYISLASCRMALAAVVPSMMTMGHSHSYEQDDIIYPNYRTQTRRPYHTPGEAPQSSGIYGRPTLKATQLHLSLQCLHSTLLRFLQPGQARHASTAMDGGSIQDQSYKVSDITLRPISTGLLFLAATIQTAGDMLQLSCSEPAKLIESALGYAGKAEGITLKPLVPAGPWQVSGFLDVRDVRDPPRLTPGCKPTPVGGLYSCDFRKRARALCNGAGNNAEVTNTTGAEQDGILNHGHRCLHDGGYDDDGDYYDDYATGRRTRGTLAIPRK